MKTFDVTDEYFQKIQVVNENNEVCHDFDAVKIRSGQWMLRDMSPEVTPGEWFERFPALVLSDDDVKALYLLTSRIMAKEGLII